MAGDRFNMESSNRLSKKDIGITPQQLVQMYRSNKVANNFQNINNTIFKLANYGSPNLYGNKDCGIDLGISAENITFNGFQYCNKYGFGNGNSGFSII